MKVKKIISGIITLAIVCTTVSSMRFTDKTVFAENSVESVSEEINLSLGKINIPLGDTETVDITLDAPEDFKYNVMCLRIEYDPALKFEGIETYNLGKTPIMYDANDDKGLIVIMMSLSQEINITGNLLGLKFSVPYSDYSNSYSIKWSDPSSYSYHLVSSNDEKQYKTNFEDGYIFFAEVGELLGDVNGDHYADITDLSILSLYLIDKKGIPEHRLKQADIDEDGKVTLSDLARLRQYVSKSVSSLRSAKTV